MLDIQISIQTRLNRIFIEALENTNRHKKYLSIVNKDVTREEKVKCEYRFCQPLIKFLLRRECSSEMDTDINNYICFSS